MKRNKKGQFRKTKRNVTLWALGLLSLAAGVYNEVPRTVEHTALATTTPEIEVVEIVDVPTIDPVEVALYFVESDTALIKAFKDSDFAAIEEILATRKAYVTAVALKSYDADTEKL